MRPSKPEVSTLASDGQAGPFYHGSSSAFCRRDGADGAPEEEPRPAAPSIVPHDCLHEARLAAPANTGGRTDRDAIVAEGANLVELVPPLEQTHAGPSLSTGTGMANIAFIGASSAPMLIYAPIAAEFPTPTR